jgi:DNA-binding IclR family transcriptional regulator
MIEPKDAAGSVVERYLQVLGVQYLVEWDVLVYLYRHQPSLINAQQISHLLDYGTSAIADALNALESLGLIERSQARQGVRWHRLTTPEDPQVREAFERLMLLDDLRPVRQLLAQRQRID